LNKQTIDNRDFLSLYLRDLLFDKFKIKIENKATLMEIECLYFFLFKFEEEDNKINSEIKSKFFEKNKSLIKSLKKMVRITNKILLGSEMQQQQQQCQNVDLCMRNCQKNIYSFFEEYLDIIYKKLKFNEKLSINIHNLFYLYLFDKKTFDYIKQNNK
jgi:hypothetical protein